MFENCHTSRSLRAGLLLLGASGALGCARSAQTDHAKRAQETSGQFATKESLSTSVESVDVAGRSITLLDADGRPFTIVTGDSATLQRLHPNDPVRLTYQEAVSFQLHDPDTQEDAPAPIVQRFETQPLPKGEGTEFRRRVDTVVEIVSVSPEGKEATFRIPEGNVRAVAIEDVRNREKVKRLRPGDAVAVVYTEKLLLQPER